MTDRIPRGLSAALTSVALLALAACAPSAPPPTPTEAPLSATATPAPSMSLDHAERLLELEERFDRTIGVYAVDTGSGDAVEYRADDRFGFASTMKAVAAGFVFATATDERLNDPVAVTVDDVVTYSPLVEQRVGGSMTLLEVADAAVRFSDNAAGNLLVRELGGPPALQRLLRGIGDTTTMVDRLEPELNDVAPGDDRDTSTPRALATTLNTLAIGDGLDETDQALLIDLLQRNTTGDALIRAAAPDGWIVGDKTGTAAHGTRNDIAIAWPPGGGAPIVIAILSKSTDADADTIDELIAAAAGVVFDVIPAG